MVEQILTCSLGKTPQWNRGMPKGGSDLWEFCAGEGLLAGLVLSLASQGQLSTELWSTPQDSWGGELSWRDGRKYFSVDLFLVQNQGE